MPCHKRQTQLCHAVPCQAMWHVPDQLCHAVLCHAWCCGCPDLLLLPHRSSSGSSTSARWTWRACSIRPAQGAWGKGTPWPCSATSAGAGTGWRRRWSAGRYLGPGWRGGCCHYGHGGSGGGGTPVVDQICHQHEARVGTQGAMWVLGVYGAEWVHGVLDGCWVGTGCLVLGGFMGCWVGAG